MGTKACIARRDGDGWSGVYVHVDGGPGQTGRTLVEMVQERGAAATLAHAATAPQGWTRFPDEPSIHHTDPFIITPEQDGGIAWLYLLTSDREIKVYRTEGWADPALRRYPQVGIIDPQSAHAIRDMVGLQDIRGGVDDLLAQRDRVLWTTVRRGLLMAVTAIDRYLKEPIAADRR